MAIDYSPLTAQVDREQVRQFRARIRSQGSGPTVTAIVTWVIGGLVAGVFLLVFVGIFGTVLGAALQSEGGPNPVALAFLAFILLVAGVVVWLVVRTVFGLGGRWLRWYRLSEFARLNALAFAPTSGAPAYSGMIFSIGDSRAVSDSLSRVEPRPLEIASYQYSTGSGKNRTTHDWGFVALQLDRALPNMVLDACGNNGLFGSSLPASFDRSQVLSLEGDFDRYFTLYCPQQYERDALYVFTPDLMALLVDEAARFDIEIVDDWLFIYSTEKFDLLDAGTLQRLFRIIDTVGTKTISQTDRYRDDRAAALAPGTVAPSGRRLRRGVPIGAVITFVIIGGFWLWSWISDFMQPLSP